MSGPNPSAEGASRSSGEGGDSGQARPASKELLGVVAELAAAAQGGFIPVPGRVVVDVQTLAHCLNVDEATVNRWITNNAVPTFDPGQRRYVDAEDFLSHLPRSGDGKEKGKRRGNRLQTRKRKVEGGGDGGAEA